MVMVRKQDGSIGFVLTIKNDEFPLSKIDTCLDTLNGCQYFSSCDCVGGTGKPKLMNETVTKRLLSHVKEYNITIQHHPGQVHGNSDALSWPCDAMQIPDSAAVPTSVARSEISDLLSHELPGSDGQALTGIAPDLSKSPASPASMDAAAHMPLSNDVSAWIQSLEATPEPESITLDEVPQAQADDHSLRPILQALKDQTKPPQSSLRQYPEYARVLLSQWDFLILQEGVLHRKFHYLDVSTNFLQIIL